MLINGVLPVPFILPTDWTIIAAKTNTCMYVCMIYTCISVAILRLCCSNNYIMHLKSFYTLKNLSIYTFHHVSEVTA